MDETPDFSAGYQAAFDAIEAEAQRLLGLLVDGTLGLLVEGPLASAAYHQAFLSLRRERQQRED